MPRGHRERQRRPLQMINSDDLILAIKINNEDEEELIKRMGEDKGGMYIYEKNFQIFKERLLRSMVEEASDDLLDKVEIVGSVLCQ